MKLYVLIIISLCMSLPTFGQDDSTEKRSDTIVDSIVSNEVISIDIKELKALRNENNSLKARINNLVKDSIDNFETKIRLNEKVQQLNNLCAKIEKMDTIIYKQCLLYPLEIRYNEQFIRDVVQTVRSFIQMTHKPSEKLTQYSDTYIPLLQNYHQYNQELINFFNARTKQVKLTNGVISDAHKVKFKNDIEQLEYYKYYRKKDNPPYESIIYLDEAIDKFFAILKKEGYVEKELEDLVNSLIPKNHKEENQ